MTLANRYFYSFLWYTKDILPPQREIIMPKKDFIPADLIPKALVLGIHAPYNATNNIESYFDEFMSLVETHGARIEHTMFIKLREIEPATFITKGKLEQVHEECKKHGIEQIIISEPLTSKQERNLQDYLRCTIIDRTQLILDIFERNAHSAQGKAQVAIAQLEHRKTRLAGRGIHLSQQSGALGIRSGFGETLKEKERRHIENEIVRLKRNLEQIARTQQIQRERRSESSCPHICLIGYTNAGKSTILNSLTKANVLAEDKLFATLDTTTRKLFLGKEQRALISDTVGFIQLLPPKLIEAFKSTLSELTYADLLLHVIDLSDGNWQEHITVVNDILEELKVKKPILYVFNKADQVALDPALQEQIDTYLPNVVISALNKESIKPLIDFLDWWLPK